ncbi:MAG TPA: nucleotide disphospho-sugar-binding domain-containing protein [Kofleriaceae bacterium]
MRVLLCPIASHGFVYPAIAVARALQRRGHSVAFATGQAFTETLAQVDLERIPRGASDGASFGIERWFDPLNVVMQVKHIEYALRRFAPDVLVSHPLALGPLLVRQRLGVPVAVLGMAAHLWPVSTAPAVTEAEQRLAWRHDAMMRHLDDARALLHLEATPATPAASPLLGDLFLLQSVPELVTDLDRLPRQAHLVGACSWEPPASEELRAWTRDAAASGEPLIYVHHGRSFDHPSFWPAVVSALGGGPFRVAAAIGRMDRATPVAPPNFYVRDHLCQGAVLPHARAVITGGNTTAALGALCHGLPSLMIPGGSEQPDVAELVARAGAALVLPITEATEHGVARAVEALLHGGELARRAQALERAFAKLDGPDTAALLIERLARTRAPVTRRDLAPVESGACP